MRLADLDAPRLAAGGSGAPSIDCANAAISRPTARIRRFRHSRGRGRDRRVGAIDRRRARSRQRQAWRVEVRKGAFMYPSLVAADSGVVRALVAASEQALDIAPPTYYASNAFDQGYSTHIGIEACTTARATSNTPTPTSIWHRSTAPATPAKVYAALIVQRLT